MRKNNKLVLIGMMIVLICFAVLPVTGGFAKIVSGSANATDPANATDIANPTDAANPFEFSYGDIDGKAGLDVDDAREALRIAVKLIVPSENQLKYGDVNGDGEVTVDDARDILRVAVKLIDVEDFEIFTKNTEPATNPANPV